MVPYLKNISKLLHRILLTSLGLFSSFKSVHYIVYLFVTFLTVSTYLGITVFTMMISNRSSSKNTPVPSLEHAAINISSF